MNTKLNKTSLNNYVKKNSPEVGADLDMKGFAISSKGRWYTAVGQDWSREEKKSANVGFSRAVIGRER